MGHMIRELSGVFLSQKTSELLPGLSFLEGALQNKDCLKIFFLSPSLDSDSAGVGN